MAYSPPVFNIEANIWITGNNPGAGDPDYVLVPVQKYLNGRGVWDVDPCAKELFTPPITVRMSIDSLDEWQSGQVFEVPAGSGQYYRARFKEIYHEDFPNAYRAVVVVQCDLDGMPLLRWIEGATYCSGATPHVGDGGGEIASGFDVEGEGSHGSAPGLHIGEGVPEIGSGFDAEGAGTNIPL